MTIKSEPLTEHTGSEIFVDREALISGALSPAIRELLVQRGVIIARGLHLTDDEQRAFTRTMGDLRLGTVKQEGEEGLQKVTFDEKVNPDYAKFFFGSLLWHMDGTYEEVPPFATILTPRVLSATGGQTEFTSNYATYEALPDDEKAWLDTLKVVHTMQAALFPGKPDCTVEEFALWHSYPNREHPLVWHHKTGRKSLVLSTSGSHVVGMHPAESHDLLQRLMAHATQPRFVYRHEWQMGDLLIWDNTGTMHRAMPYPADSGRQLHRFTLNGEEPVRGVA
ncbi:TauD/TfdA family dioxygenase [Novosphingobium sp. TH158]|uniref:TauD/TfdA dioxygenase family protein n=1 Tax=Novosphingobium sp. TH158 TaxID=2067455 RepID=UPI000C7E17A2|nr:TauD/TfdA family dioxygenase [Novosphingobium sp. TH158]PLK26218.1 taurine catabolism dioxygenase [Novosphingobium sp. TH158]